MDDCIADEKITVIFTPNKIHINIAINPIIICIMALDGDNSFLNLF
jgi:hypothetical protein